MNGDEVAIQLSVLYQSCLTLVHHTSISVQCPKIRAPEVNDTSRMVGDVVRIICPNSTRQLGPEVVTCESNGQWQPPIPDIVCIGELNPTDRSNRATIEQLSIGKKKIPLSTE